MADSLEVDFQRSARFGPLAPGEWTDYHSFEGAYRYGSLRATSGSAEYTFMPEDYVGEHELGAGRYTHIIRLVEWDGVRTLEGETIRDD